MKFKLIISIFFVFLILPAVKADLQLSVTPSEIWAGNSLSIRCWYTANETNIITPWVYIDKTSQNITLTAENSTYFIYSYSPPLLGTYSVYCSNSTTSTSTTSFKVSDLSASSDLPSVAYKGDKLSFNVKIVKISNSNETVNSGVNFKVFLGSNEISLNNDKTFFLNNQWTVETNSISLEAKTYTLTLNISYNNKTVALTKSLEVKNSTEFQVSGIDKPLTKSNDTITLTMNAKEKGSPIQLQASYLSIQINNINSPITEISSVGGNSQVKVLTPQLKGGSYKLKTSFTYNGQTFVDEKTIKYTVPVSGKFLNSGDKAIYANLRFSGDEIQQTFSTDDSGSFSGSLPSGTYTVEITFPLSTLTLNGVIIDSGFDNPIKFDRPTDVEIEGMATAGIFVYEIAIPFTRASIAIQYDDSKVLDENNLEVYKCSAWNFGKRSCISTWDKINADIDTVRNSAKFTTMSFSAFSIAVKKKLNTDFSLNKPSYNLNDIIKIKGLAKDENGKLLSDVEIKVSVPDADIETSTKSDNSGLFSFEFPTPKSEGRYNLILTAEKSPYISFNKTKEFEVIKSKKISLTFIDSIRLKKGENRTLEAVITNTGEIDLKKLNVSIENLPKEFYELPLVIESLLIGEEKKIPINFFIPEDAGSTVLSSILKVSTEYNINSEQNFILTILAKNETKSSQASKDSSLPNFQLKLPSGFLVLPSFNIGTFIFGFIIGTILIVFLLRKRKNRGNLMRSEINNLLSDIKKEMNRIKSKGPKENDYSKVSQSEIAWDWLKEKWSNYRKNIS